MKNVIGVLLLLISLVGVGVFGYLTWSEYMEYKTAVDNFSAVEDAYVEVVHEELPEEQREESSQSSQRLEIDFQGLIAKNSDVIGWIHIPGIDVSYPILKGTDYLRKDMDNKYSTAGCIFVGDTGSSSLDLKNNVIHGHDMRNKSMFGRLDELKAKENIVASPYFYIYKPNGDVEVYEIKYAGDLPADHEIYYTVFASEDEFANYISMDVKGNYNDRDSIDVNDQLVTLSTCTVDDSKRTVVQGVLVTTHNQ